MTVPIATAAIVDASGNIRALTKQRQPDEQVTAAQVADTSWLARLLIRMLRDVADLRRRFWPRRVDFEDRAVDATGTKLFRFAHGLDARVRWWAVDATGAVPALQRNAATDSNTLVLTSTVACTVTIRVEEAG